MSSVSFPDVPRFEMLSRLGEGGMGVVYEAYDREYDAKVALKVLRFSEHGERIQKFKEEFRALQEIRHPNLARFLELMEHDGRWFFTMELVNGTNFLDWIRPGSNAEEYISGVLSELPTEKINAEAFIQAKLSKKLTRQGVDTLDKNRLLEGFVQLARGLLFLHLANKVHRDIKPSNILVDDSGRVVVLDFGLSTEIGEVQRGELLGTPVYMAPELAELGTVGSAADWYSVGVMLFEALTGQLPVSGGMSEILKSKTLQVAPAPSLVDPSVDEMWDFLCTCLMHFDPDKRPGGKEILSLLGSEQAPSPAGPKELDDTTLVGRAAELARLRHAFNGLSVKKSSTIFVYGESGVGKSELMGVFGRSLSNTDTLLLSGQCYQKESVPYKAVDGVVDALAAYLQTLEPTEIAKMQLSDMPLLVRAFPVMRQVASFRERTETENLHQHPMVLRARVFLALRTLLTRIAQTTKLVLLIDDLQWADQDSLDLLRALLLQPEEPGMLLVASVRTPADLHFRRQLEEKLEVIAPDIEKIDIGVLDPIAAQELASRVSEELGLTNVTPEQIAKEAEGHPFFIEVLLRYCYTQGRHGGHSLNEALTRHIEELSEPDRVLLEFLSLAEKPLPRDVAAKATGQTLEQLRDCVDSLQAEKLVRGNGIRNTDTIALYHSRVREVAASLNLEVKKKYYRSLASALEDGHSSDLETLARYWLFAGESNKAAMHFELAADDAVRTTAFKRASRLYREVIELRTKLGSHDNSLWTKLAGTLSNAGLGSEAADAYGEAIQTAEANEIGDLKRIHAEQLLQCGRVDEGIVGLHEVLHEEGFKVPKTNGQVLRNFLLGRVKIRFRRGGLRFREVDESDCDNDKLRKLDALWAACVGLLNIDPLPALGFHNRHLLLALEVGEPIRISRSLAFECGVLASNDSDPETIAEILDVAEELAKKTGHSHTQAWSEMMRAVVKYFLGDWHSTLEHCGRASQFLSKCTGVSWDERTVQLLGGWSDLYLGNFTKVVREAPQHFTSSVQRGDLYSAIVTCSGLPNTAWLILDQPKEARRKADWGIARWSQAGFHLQHLLDLFAQAQIDLYEGNAESAWRRIDGSWRSMKKAGLMQLAFNRVLMYELRGRVALAMAIHRPSSSGHFLKIVEKAGKQLAGEKHAWAQTMASLLGAQVCLLKEEDMNWRELVAAQHAFEKCDMILYAQATSRVVARLSGNSPNSYFSDNGVVAPDSFVRLFVPLMPA